MGGNYNVAWILMALAGLAMVVGFIYSIIFLIQIFTTSGPLWGLGSLFVPFVSIIWLVLNWDAGKDSFLKSLGYNLLGGMMAVGAAALSH